LGAAAFHSPFQRPSTKKLDYRVFRDDVRKDFRETWADCLLGEMWAAGLENFELDHFRPMSLFPHLAMIYYNLYWSCHVCNRLKRNCWPSRISSCGEFVTPYASSRTCTCFFSLITKLFIKAASSFSNPGHRYIDK